VRLIRCRRKPKRINERASERGLSFFVERGGKIIRKKEKGKREKGERRREEGGRRREKGGKVRN